MTLQHIFGIHEFGGEQHILDAGRTGWIVDTVAVKDAPFGRDYRSWDSRGLRILCRLNWGYEPDGTIPFQWAYGDYARRCAAFVEKSQGCSRWIIGNEMNTNWEWPGGRQGEPISAEQYAICFRMVAAEIRAAQPEAEAEIILGAVGPWNVTSGDWLRYFEDLCLMTKNQAGGIALHTYTHGADPALVFSDAKMDEPYAQRHFHFRAYRDFMERIPHEMRQLPVYITETDQDVVWEDRNSGWVQNAYQEIDDWNQEPGHQQIHALCLYRWPNIDKWVIDGKQGVVEDFRRALQHDYRPRVRVQGSQYRVRSSGTTRSPREWEGPGVGGAQCAAQPRVYS
ncbi:hypothetical protein KFU94_18705 [Chloroflexi bacterium TSY]|nr:hypothetical protein [Chloroflexi bacterium TSY]